MRAAAIASVGLLAACSLDLSAIPRASDGGAPGDAIASDADATSDTGVIECTCEAGAGCWDGRCARVLSLAGGYEHTCALLDDGDVACWGGNSYGELGNGDRTGRGAPTRVVGLPGRAVQVVAGQRHACARLEDLRVACWGIDTSGQTGDGAPLSLRVVEPAIVRGLESVIDLAGGAAHTCALRDATPNEVWCWGYAANGQLGTAATDPSPIPIRVPGLVDPIAVACGGFHSCAVEADSTGRCWGYNGYGQLSQIASAALAAVPVELAPMTPLTDIRDFALGTLASCALRNGGDVWCWGSADRGQLGDGTFTSRHTPAQVPGVTGAVEIAAGPHSTCAVLATGEALCWGENDYAQLGIGEGADAISPMRARVDEAITTMSFGTDYACAVGTSGAVLCWGRNAGGQLGDGAPRHVPVPERVEGAPATTIAVTGSTSHFCAHAPDAIGCWGYNEIGMLGDGTLADRSTPVPVAVTGALEVSAGSTHTCARLATGVSCWGANGSYQLGRIDTQPILPPGPVTDLEGLAVADVEAGGQHNCVVTSEGAVGCWGNNNYGQLGQATMSMANSVAVLWPVALASGMVEVALGEWHSCALARDGVVSCFGLGIDGQLGDGMLRSRVAPTAVLDLDPARSVSAGSVHTCAITTTGALYCWGSNDDGQLGDGTTTRRTLPAHVATLSDVRAVSAGTWHTCAIVGATGEVHCWGSNANGALGDGTLVSSPTPVRALLDGRATSIAAVAETTCAVTDEGLYCWGSVDYGKTGDGRPLIEPVPIRTAGSP